VKPKGFNLEVVKGSGQLPDPQKILDPIVNLLAGAVKVPKQLLLGTEAGALASGEVNLEQYYAQVADVQSTFAEPLLIGFYKQLQEWGILDEGNFDIEWIPLWEMDEKDRAEIDKMKMETARLALGSVFKGEEPLLSVQETREQILGLNPEIGKGRLPTMKTEASEETKHKEVLDFSIETLNQHFQRLINSARIGKPEDKILDEAEELIGEYVDKARENARHVLERRLAHSIPELSPEQNAEFEELAKKYLSDFKNILTDALKNE